MSYPAEQLAALLRQTQHLAEMKANENIDDENRIRNSESPQSNQSANSENVGKIICNYGIDHRGTFY